MRLRKGESLRHRTPPVHSNLQLVSARAAGKVVDAAVCGVSAHGGTVLFLTRNGCFEPEQVFLKDVSGNSATCVVPGSECESCPSTGPEETL